MYGLPLIAFSICSGLRFLPPEVMTMSFLRSMILRSPFSARMPTSPVGASFGPTSGSLASGSRQ